MKRLLAFSLLFGLGLQSQATDRLTVENFSIAPGEEKQISICLENEVQYTAFEFTLELPSGISVKETGGGALYIVRTDRLKPENELGEVEQHNLTTNKIGTGIYRVLSYSSSGLFIAGNSGDAILKVTVIAGSETTPGIYKTELKDVKLATSGSSEDGTLQPSAKFDYSVIGTIATGITLSTDGLSVVDEDVVDKIPETVSKISLSYTRTLTVGATDEMYTVCLPYDPPTGDNLKYYTLSTVSGTTLTFDEVTAPEAYKPYLVVASATSYVSATEENVDLSTNIGVKEVNDGEYELCGTLYGMTNAEAAAGGNIYILQDAGKWGLVTTANTAADIPPFRAYIVKKSVGGSARLHSVVGNATGINPLSVSSEGESKGVWYTLGGLELTGEPTQKGAYVKDGRVIIK